MNKFKKFNRSKIASVCLLLVASLNQALNNTEERFEFNLR